MWPGVCRELDIKMMYISTDYVFNGQGERPWEPDDPREPLNVYGQTKYEGELAVEQALDKYFIVRIAWVFGVYGKNFVRTMLRLGAERGAVSVVDDQIGSPHLHPGSVPPAGGHDSDREIRPLSRHQRGALQLV